MANIAQSEGRRQAENRNLLIHSIMFSFLFFFQIFRYLRNGSQTLKGRNRGELICLLVRPTILLEFILVTGNRNCVIGVTGRKPEEFGLAQESQLVREVGDFLLSVLIVQKNYLGSFHSPLPFRIFHSPLPFRIARF